jgi:hypothetical protein
MRNHNQQSAALKSVLVVTVIAALQGCAGNGQGLDANGRPAGSGSAPLVATLASIQDNVFTPICTACHVGAGAPLGFRLDANSAYAMLVNTPSVEVPSLARVTPGNPDASYLIQKLEGHAAVGSRMPLNQPPLPQATIDVIRQWISNGAQANAVQSPSQKAASVHAVAPRNGELLAEQPREILVAADRELDLTLLNANSLELLRSGGDGDFTNGNEVAMHGIEVHVRSTSPTTIALQMPSGSWVADDYQLRIRGTGPAPLADLRGVAIDGTGSGLPGSDLLVRFTVAATDGSAP